MAYYTTGDFMAKKTIQRRTSAANDDKFVKREITYDRKVYDALMERKKETGVAVTEQVRKALVRDLNNDENKPRPYIPLYGEIPAGVAKDILPAPPSQFIRPPFHDLPEDCYALTVKGKSMTSDFGISVENGLYALFAPGVIFPNMIVHVEFSDGQFQHSATLKKYVPRGEGKTEFRPLNKEFKTIIVDNGTFTIKGGFIKAWVGSAKSKSTFR